MYVIAIYGLLIILVSLLMIAKPDLWVKKAVQYCRLSYMHPLEILICVGFGVPFILYAEDSKFPVAFKIFGYMLAGVGIALILIPPSFHQRYGIWSIQKIGKYFRLAGVFSLIFGAFLVYAVF